MRRRLPIAESVPMIDHTDAWLIDWVKSVLTNIEVSLRQPGGGADQRSISLYLLELVDTPAPRSTQRTPLQFSLRYLVTAWAVDPVEEHRLLSDLVFAAM